MNLAIIYDPDEGETNDEAEALLSFIKERLKDDYPEINEFIVISDD